MSRTWGQIALETTKFAEAQGVRDPDLILGWIQAAYNEILGSREWPKLEGSGVLSLTAQYATGTVAVSNGATAVTGTDTVWTAGMTGRKFRVTGRNESYTFTRTGATTGTLDRAYEGDDDADATYAIYQSIYALDAGVKSIISILNPQLDKVLEFIHRSELDRIDPYRAVSGDPQYWTPTDDTAASLRQIEVYPIPETAYGLPYTYRKIVTPYDGTAPTTSPLLWVSDDAIISGACERVLRHVKDYAGVQAQQQETARFLATMQVEESLASPPLRLRMAERFTRHRVTRWNRG